MTVAHPRSRGENRSYGRYRRGGGGSSPLTRGKPATYQVTAKLGGLIPAHAGKTSSGSRPPAPPRAHPRSRGENYERKTGQPITSGSSPLTRGKPRVRYLILLRIGLIPAHAGKTHQPNDVTQITQAHPRSRGENSPDGSERRVYKGSSPLTRGKLTSLALREVSLGLIPAHAGKTACSCAAWTGPPAHPRSRGENSSSSLLSSSEAGSSPLTRGKRR